VPNSIAHPLVEDVDTGELDGLIRLDTLADGAVVISLLRPVLNGATAAALTEAFETLHGADHVRIVFLKAAGKVFCTGADPAWLKVSAEDWSESDLREEALKITGMLHALTAVPALTVALIEGEAIGAGAGLAAACDLAVATVDTRFAFPDVTHGATSALVAPFVVNAIGPRQAKALFATGRTFDAAHAEKIGLIHEIVEDPEGLNAAADRLTEQALAAAPRAVAESKRLVWEVWGKAQDHALMRDVAHRFARARFSDEGREGLAATLAGRRPNWVGE
jgi:methylglutaconyl-CoA hydratase